LEGERILNPNTTFGSTFIRYGTRLTLRERPMQVFVRTAEGGNVTVNARRSDTVKDMKEKLYQARNVPVSHQRLQYQGKPLEDDHTLRSYGICNNSSVESTYRLRGGAI
jgi:hypothetical protein